MSNIISQKMHDKPDRFYGKINELINQIKELDHNFIVITFEYSQA